MPSWLLNPFSIECFNHFYYNRSLPPTQSIHYEPFFYPLDGIADWNRLYGRKGFVQYQFVIPKSAGIEGMRVIFEKIVASRKGAFLAVLKTLGAHNRNLLSFPIEGYTLAVDFKLENDLWELLNELDAMVLDYGGRIYLAKDARMSATTFKRSYPKWEAFQETRERYHAIGSFASLQSQRLGLDT
jgi:FAD/FMN-containing dehydrogenase